MIIILGFIAVTFLGLWMVETTKSIEWLNERVDKLEKLTDTDNEVEE